MAKTSGKKKAVAKKSPVRAAVFGVLIVAALAGAIALVMNASGFAKMATERIASQTLGVKVSIASLDISLQEKQIKVTGLRVGNPEGYAQPLAASIDSIIIAAETIAKDKLVFSDISVSGTTLNLEVKETGSNVTDLRETARTNAAGAKQAQEPVKVIIRRLTVEKGVLNPGMVLAAASTETKPQPMTLPDIRINGIGEKEGGVPAQEAIAEVVNYVTQVAIRSAIEQGFLRGMTPESLKLIQQQLGLPANFMDQVRDLGDQIKGLFDN